MFEIQPVRDGDPELMRIINNKKWMILAYEVPEDGPEKDMYIVRDEEIMIMQRFSFLPHMCKSELYSLILDAVEETPSGENLFINI